MSRQGPNDITPFDGYEYDGPDPATRGLAAAHALGGGAGVPGGALGGPMEMPGAGRKPASLFSRIHAALRGRYWIAILIGVITGAAGGYFGYKSQEPTYRGEGLIHVAFDKLRVTDESDRTPFLNYEEYLSSQALVMSSQTLLRMASQQPDWPTSIGPAEGEALKKLAVNLTVEHPPRTELIKVQYLDANPRVAGGVVRSLIAAYTDFVGRRANAVESKRLLVLSNRVAQLSGEVDRLDAQILELAKQAKAPSLDSLLEAKMNEEGKLSQELHTYELALIAAREKKENKQVEKDLTYYQIAMVDPTMRTKVGTRDEVVNEIERLKVLGVLPENTKMKQLDAMLKRANAAVEEYAGEWRDMQRRQANDPNLVIPGLPHVGSPSVEFLAARVAALKNKLKEVQDEREKMGVLMVQLKDLQRQREEKAKERNETAHRKQVLEMEQSVGSRMQVVQDGSDPTLPYKDRRTVFGAAGALGGFALPISFLVLLGLADKRYRFSDEAENVRASGVPLLGILPRLPDRLTDPEQAAVAAHCIHQIRIMLQVGGNPEERRVFMITSASTGDGKTSLTMALGLSFAASGSKTLVVDCDMVGQGLTHRLKAYDVPGLVETLEQGTLRGHVRKTGTKGLYVLPIGRADAVHAGALSPHTIKRLLTACREHFDIIVLDTGPVLGSLEASVVAAEADGVIMAVARGQQQPLVDKAVAYLRSLGANLMGIVFNRAEHRDFQRSVPSASIRSATARPSEPLAILPDSDEASRFGPLARSVASCLPGSSHVSNSNGGN